MNNILIVGTGALATLFAARLAQAGHPITMLGSWQAGLDALRDHGARMLANGEEHRFEVRAINDPRECPGIKYALVLVKAWQTEHAAEQLRQCLAADGLAVTLQNGLGNRETLARVLDRFATENTEETGENNSKDSPGMICLANHARGRCVRSVAGRRSRVALGTTTTGATLLGPGRVRAGGEGIVSIEQNPALGPLETALRSAKFNVNVVEDAQSLVWGKLVINAAINPLTALLRVPNGELLERPAARQMMAVLARETAQVADAEKIRLPFPDPAAAAEEVARKTAANHSSMLQDVLRGAPTEIDAICGAVVNAAQTHKIDTPANWACWKLVRALAD